MEWESPALLLSVRPYGEADIIATALTATEGRHVGLVQGGQSRRHAGVWQAGNLLALQWRGRSADGLGRFTAELVYPAAAVALDDPEALSVLNALCATADGALPERERQPIVFSVLLPVVAALQDPSSAVAALIRWEVTLLAALGFGLELSRCAISGSAFGLTHVSPRTGRAVTSEAAGQFANRLLKLPGFLLPGANAEPSVPDLAAGLALTGHFLARDAFGAHHRPLPSARITLYERLVRRSEES